MGLTDLFIKHELRPDFLAELNTAIQNFERAIGDKAVGREAHLGAGAGFDTALNEALTAIQRLDAIVANKLRDDSVRLAVWASARHIARPTHAKPAPPAPTPPAAKP